MAYGIDAGRNADEFEPSRMQTPTAAEARLPAIGRHLCHLDAFHMTNTRPFIQHKPACTPYHSLAITPLPNALFLHAADAAPDIKLVAIILPPAFALLLSEWTFSPLGAGLVDPGHLREAHVVTWPTAAADLMVVPPQTTPSSPASSGIAGCFSNKRSKIEVPDAPFGLQKTSTTWRPNPFHSQSAQLPAWQCNRLASTPDTARKADLQSDADSDPLTADAAVPQQRIAESKISPAAVSSDHSWEQQVPTAVPDLLASPEQLNTDAGDSSNAEHGSFSGCDSPVNQGASSDSLPFQLVDYKGKGFKGLSPLLPAALEQESKLDHLKKGNWVWWKPDSTWLLARVRPPAQPCIFSMVPVIALTKGIGAQSFGPLTAIDNIDWAVQC